MLLNPSHTFSFLTDNFLAQESFEDLTEKSVCFAVYAPLDKAGGRRS